MSTPSHPTNPEIACLPETTGPSPPSPETHSVAPPNVEEGSNSSGSTVSPPISGSTSDQVEKEEATKSTNVPKEKTTKKSRSAGGSATKNRGRKKGAKKWTEGEHDVLLSSIEDNLPTGKLQWEDVATDLTIDGYNRTWEACKKRFEKLFSTPKPTGSAEVPRHVVRSLILKDKIEAKEYMGHAGRNDSASSDDSDVEILPGLASTKLKGEDGNARRPATKKRKVEERIDKLMNPNNIHSKSIELQSNMVEIMGTLAKSIIDRQSDKSESVNKQLEELREEMKTSRETMANLLEVMGKVTSKIDNSLNDLET